MVNVKMKSLPINSSEVTHCITGNFDNGEGRGYGIMGFYRRDIVGEALSEMLAADPGAELRVEPFHQALTFEPLRSTDVEWILNDQGEIGVKIGDQFFFNYKGESLMYSSLEDTSPKTYRLVGKRELDETLSLDSVFQKDGFLDRGTWRPLNFKTAKNEIAWYSSEDRD